jgi:nucleoside-diphosphate-sugar epimerase
MKAAVSGAGGYVGRHIVAGLQARGHTVIALSRRSVAGLEHLGFDLPDTMPSAAQLRQHGVETVVHAAWDFSPARLEAARRINVEPSAKLAAAAAEAGAGLIGLSTMSAFAGCRSVYGRSKLEMEQSFLDRGGLVLRPGLVWSDAPGGMVGTLSRLAKLPVVPVIAGGGRLWAVHAEDLAAVIVRAVEARPAPQVLTAAHPKPHGLDEIMRLLAAARHPLLLPVPWPLAWLGARLAQAILPKAGIRADSITGLVHANPAPVFAALSGVLKEGDLRPFLPRQEPPKGRQISQ